MNPLILTPAILSLVIIALWSAWGYSSSRVEQASYTIIKKTADYEIREYPRRIVAETTVTGDPRDAMTAGFRIVARYIFGGNSRGERIAMTAPVLSTATPQDRTIAFGMPAASTLETLPTPTDSRIKIVTIPRQLVVAHRFRGYRSDKGDKKIMANLQRAMERDGLVPAPPGTAVWADYNPPWTPPWLNRHDIMIEIQRLPGKKMIVAGGCFWGMEALIRHQPGVIDTVVGYTGGAIKNPTYENHDGHAEAVEITYDPSVTSFHQLLDFFFRIHDPTTLNQQGNDSGSSYRSAIFYQSLEEKSAATQVIEIVNHSRRWKKPVVTTLEPLDTFYPAEDYHQDYLQKHPNGYTCHRIYFGSYLTPSHPKTK